MGLFTNWFKDELALDERIAIDDEQKEVYRKEIVILKSKISEYLIKLEIELEWFNLKYKKEYKDVDKERFIFLKNYEIELNTLILLIRESNNYWNSAYCISEFGGERSLTMAKSLIERIENLINTEL